MTDDGDEARRVKGRFSTREDQKHTREKTKEREALNLVLPLKQKQERRARIWERVHAVGSCCV